MLTPGNALLHLLRRFHDTPVFLSEVDCCCTKIQLWPKTNIRATDNAKVSRNRLNEYSKAFKRVNIRVALFKDVRRRRRTKKVV